VRLCRYRIYIRVRMAVTGEKFAQNGGSARSGGSREESGSVAAADEFEAAEDESAHEISLSSASLAMSERRASP